MSEVAALIADMVRAGVDADLIGRTAQALAEREPVFVRSDDSTGTGIDDAGSSYGEAGASRRARNRRYYERRKASEQRLKTTDSDAVKTLSDGVKTPDGQIKTASDGFKTPASEFKTVTGFAGEPAKENTPHTPQEKNSPLKEKAPKGAQKKVPPEPTDKGLFEAEPEADLIARPDEAEPTAASAGTDRKRRSRRHGGDITGLTAEFDTHVWPLYPQKVARKTAAKAWASARQRADFDTIMDGLKRYVAKRDDRPWCNLSTWLNQDRWTDRLAVAPARAPPSPSGRQSRSEQIRDHNRRVSEALHKRMRQDNGNATADIIDIDRSDWTVEGSA
ncbi:UNVERIFIED_ORG: hypothetical protein BCL66_10457 [Martelella mediterranea]